MNELIQRIHNELPRRFTSKQFNQLVKSKNPNAHCLHLQLRLVRMGHLKHLGNDLFAIA